LARELARRRRAADPDGVSEKKRRWYAARHPPIERTCMACGKTFFGRTNACVCSEDCRDKRYKEARRRWALANPKRQRNPDARRRWVENNREKIRECRRRWYAANRSRLLETYREYFKETARRWRAANPERYRENARRWRDANPEKVIAATLRWRAAHRAQILEKSRGRAPALVAEQREVAAIVRAARELGLFVPQAGLTDAERRREHRAIARAVRELGLV
jgi:hypothetical protein